MTTYTDQQLLELLQQSDMPAFHQLYDRYWQLLFELAEKKTGNTSDAKDLVQELFIDIWNRRRQLDIKGTLRVYLISALYLKIFKHFRTKGFQEEHYRSFAAFLAYSEDVVSLNAAVKETEQELGAMQEVLENTIRQMPAQMQKVFTLKHLHQYTTSQIAEELEISTHTVKNHLKQGMQRLRKAGEQYPTALLLLAWMAESSY